MAHRSAARPRPVVDAAQRIHVVQTDTATREGGGVTALLESATQEILAVTYWFDPAPNPGPYPVTVRFSGRRVDVKGRLWGLLTLHVGRGSKLTRPLQLGLAYQPLGCGASGCRPRGR